MSTPYRAPSADTLGFVPSAPREHVAERDAALRPGLRPWETMGIAIIVMSASYFLAPAALATAADVMNVLLCGQVAIAGWLWRSHSRGVRAAPGPLRGCASSDGLRVEDAEGGYEHWSWDQIVCARVSARAVTIVMREDETLVLPHADNPDAARVARLVASKARGSAWGPARGYALVALAHVAVVGVALVAAHGASPEPQPHPPSRPSLLAPAPPPRPTPAPEPVRTPPFAEDLPPMLPRDGPSLGRPDRGTATEFLRAWFDQVDGLMQPHAAPDEERARTAALARLFDRLLDGDAVGRELLGLMWDAHPPAELLEVQALFPLALADDPSPLVLPPGGYALTNWREQSFADGVVLVLATARPAALGDSQQTHELTFWVHRVGDQWRVFDVACDGESMTSQLENRLRLHRAADDVGWQLLLEIIRAARAASTQ